MFFFVTYFVTVVCYLLKMAWDTSGGMMISINHIFKFLSCCKMLTFLLLSFSAKEKEIICLTFL